MLTRLKNKIVGNVAGTPRPIPPYLSFASSLFVSFSPTHTFASSSHYCFHSVPVLPSSSHMQFLSKSPSVVFLCCVCSPNLTRYFYYFLVLAISHVTFIIILLYYCAYPSNSAKQTRSCHGMPQASCYREASSSPRHWFRDRQAIEVTNLDSTLEQSDIIIQNVGG